MNNKTKSNKSLLSAGVFAAIAASLCCITPALAVLGGLGGIASTFSFLEPLRPYLIAITVVVLGFAFYEAYKPKKEPDIDCACEPALPEGGNEESSAKNNFLNSKPFLWIITVVSILMFTFPSYSGIFFPEDNAITFINSNNIVEATMQIEGMTCTSCEHSVDFALKTEKGVISATSSYEKGIAKIKYDKSKVSPEALSKAVEDKVGYRVTDYKIENYYSHEETHE